MEKQPKQFYDRFSNWLNSSITLKMVAIGFLIILFVIPLAMIDDVIRERSYRKQEVVHEISESWSSAQTINGPILSVPYQTYGLYTDSEGKERKEYFDHIYHILPQELNISGPIDHESRSRGIFDVTVYDANLHIEGGFVKPKLDIPHLQEIRWEDAYLTIGVSDMKGIKDEIDIRFNNQNLNVEPGSKISSIIASGITMQDLGIDQIDEGQAIPFVVDMSIRGSKELQFIPLGKQTEVNLTSSWPDPSFFGEYITTANEVTADGFTANWKILHLNRNYPQQWIDNKYADHLGRSAFGVRLYSSADDYQAVTRASKYGLMTVALTFLVFFLVEIMNKRRIHPLQYILVGLGLSLFYALLISITEHSSFTFAYAIAASSIIGMIFLYSVAIFKDYKLSFGLLAVMMAVYTFVFVTLQLVDYALLIGSIGLTLILALTMYLTRNIDWFNIGQTRLNNSSIENEMA